MEEEKKALTYQIGGNHYGGKYQPVELAERLKMFFTCGCISKRIYRYKKKGGLLDLQKILQEIEFLKIYRNWYNVTHYEANNELYYFLSENPQLDSLQRKAYIALIDCSTERLENAIKEMMSTLEEKEDTNNEN